MTATTPTQLLQTLHCTCWRVNHRQGGWCAIQMHQGVGEKAKALGIEGVFGFGALSKATVEEFGSNGQWFEEQQDLIDALMSNKPDALCVLVKGSRSMRMDRVVSALLGGDR